MNMKYRLLVVAGFVSILSAWSCTKAPEPTSTATQATKSPAQTGDVEATIARLEKDWVAAIQKKDLVALDGLLADDFVGTSPTAQTFRKTDAIDDLKNAKYVVDKMDMGEVSVNVYGTSAVAFTTQDEKSKYGGQDTSGHYLFTDVWVKKEGRWQVVASHGSRYATP
jgi:ketosteroid isomerase-like protein